MKDLKWYNALGIVVGGSVIGQLVSRGVNEGLDAIFKIISDKVDPPVKPVAPVAPVAPTPAPEKSYFDEFFSDSRTEQAMRDRQKAMKSMRRAVQSAARKASVGTKEAQFYAPELEEKKATFYAPVVDVPVSKISEVTESSKEKI